MTWVKLDDHIDENPKLAMAGPLGFALYVAGLAYCNRTLTDGFIPDSVARRLLGLPHPKKTIGALVEHGLWRSVPNGYVVHDYLEFQPSREEVEELREARVNAGRKGAEARWKDGKSHGKCHSKTMASGMANGCPEPVPEPVRENREENAGVFNNIADVVELTRRAVSKAGEAA